MTRTRNPVRHAPGWLLFLAVAGLGLSAASAAPAKAVKAAKPAAKPAAYAEVPDDPALPRVLIIGDSISIGYTPVVRELMKGKANVRRPATNCAATLTGLKELDAWLGAADKWDVIHFNWGLHDLKYCDEKAVITDVDKGHQQVPVADYEKNLRTLVERMQKTGARLIFATTTPVPEGAKGRVPADVAKYNEAALRVMKDLGVAVDDLNAAATPNLAAWQNKKDVHYNATGYKGLAESVVKTVEAELARKP